MRVAKMEQYVEYNANPTNRRVGDCTVRAISTALGEKWEDTYSGMAIQGLIMADMPSANVVWAAYLKFKGFEKHPIPNDCPDCYTVKDFCKDHPQGTYVLALNGHAVAVKDGRYYDIWNSGNEVPFYYFEKPKGE
jgi:hypothetical protein